MNHALSLLKLVLKSIKKKDPNALELLKSLVKREKMMGYRWNRKNVPQTIVRTPMTLLLRNQSLEVEVKRNRC